MNKQCIGCKREISTGHSECPICGAPQSFIRYHRSSILFFILVSMAVLLSAHWYIGKIQESSALENQKMVEQKTLESTQKISLLEEQLGQTKEELAQANTQVSQLQTQQSNQSSQANSQVSQLKQQLTQAQANEKRQSDRASWLSRENQRLKTEIETLKAASISATQVPTTNTPTTDTPEPTQSDQSEQQDDTNEEQSGQSPTSR